MSVYSKISKVMADVGAIPKDKTNKFVGYRYSSTDAIYTGLRQLMAKHNIICLPAIVDVNIVDGQYHINYEFTLIDADKPDSIITMPWFQHVPVEAKGNKGFYVDDKAVGKANTYAHRYFLMKLFLISDGNDDDIENSEQVEVQPSPQQSTPNQAQRAALWDKIKSDNFIRKRYENENHLKNTVALFADENDGKTVYDVEYSVIQNWLLDRESKS
jgi:hypothetical protein